MLYKVRIGYTLYIGNKHFKGGEVVDVAEKDIQNQSWKVEQVPVAPVEDTNKKEKKGKKDKAPPLPPGFKAIPTPPATTAMRGQDVRQEGEEQ